jgi:uncharacterized membrane protein YbhN (UPF0104 family)
VGKQTLKLLLKLSLTGLALFVVFRKIDVEETWLLVLSANGYYLLLAVCFFVCSKIFSALRLNLFFRDLGLIIPSVQNLKLYAIGMFYNLFLPGGIGGDGYKVYLLNRQYGTPVKNLLSSVFLDRINGLAMLVFLMFLLLFHVEMVNKDQLNPLLLAWLGLFTVPLAFYTGMRFFFQKFMYSLPYTLLYSFFVQLMQLACCYFILLGLDVQAQILEYLFVFLLSSIVAVLPLTIGGVGARELVFIFSHGYIGIDKNTAVAFSLLFFVITATTSLTGIFFRFKKEVLS